MPAISEFVSVTGAVHFENLCHEVAAPVLDKFELPIPILILR
jgi:hypothetical protein